MSTLHENLTKAADAASFLRGDLLAANADAASANPLACLLLLDLVGQAARIEQRIGEIVAALEAQP